MFTGIWRDLVHAGRSLAKARTFTFVCVVSLGIGMAPVIAIPFGARMFRIPPVGVNTEGLVELLTTPQGGRPAANNWSYPDFVDLRAADTGIAMTGWVHGASTTTIQTAAGTQTTSVGTMFVSANYFRTTGVALARGPGFDAAVDDPLRADPTVIVGHNFWQNNLGADPDIVGKTLTLDGNPHVVVGVAPEHFSGHLVFQGRALFVPLERHPRLRDDTDNVRLDRANEWLHIHGRLSSGVSVAQASAAVSAVTSQLATQYPATNEFRAGVAEGYDALGGGDHSVFTRIQAVALSASG